MLLLDEPTNHLDVEAIEALIDALKNYTGGVMVISHDQHFINQVCNEIWVVKDKTITRFPGTFNDYKKSILSQLPVVTEFRG